MNRFYRASLLLALVALFGGVASAQSHPVEGIYAVTAVGSDIGTVAFNLTLTRVADKWTGVISDAALPMTVKMVSVDVDNKVLIVASAGDAEVTIVGKFDSGKIAGEWTAGDAKGTWSATRKDAMAGPAPTGGAAPASAAVPAATLALLEGTYDGEVTADGQGSLPFTLILKRSGDKLVPELQNAGDLGATAFAVNGENVVISATFQGNAFALPGKLTGTNMAGKWEAGGFTGSWSAKKKVN
jgi:hypothetical protein